MDSPGGGDTFYMVLWWSANKQVLFFLLNRYYVKIIDSPKNFIFSVQNFKL